MNDELSAQLTRIGYRIPTYLQPHLMIVTEHDTLKTEGEPGLFQLNVPAPQLDLYAGGEDGVLLRRLRWQPDTLEWDGSVNIAGSVDSLTIVEINGLPLTVLSVVGVPLLPDVTPYATATARQNMEMVPPAFEDGAIQTEEAFYTFLAPEDSPLVTLAENALMNRLRLWLYGTVAADETGWGEHFAVPVVLESATLFAPL
ncbi:MAG: hypothetical protein AAF653_05190 [Chloroflexota bacterium]